MPDPIPEPQPEPLPPSGPSGPGGPSGPPPGPANDPPVALPDENRVTEGDPVPATGNVIEGSPGVDSDPDGDTIKVSGVAAGEESSPVTGGVGTEIVGTYGKVVIEEDGSYTYTLDEDKANPIAEGDTKTDTFTYTITDDKGGTATTTLKITVTGTNDMGALAPDIVTSTPEDGPKTGNVFEAATQDPDAGEQLEISKFTIGGMPGEFTPGGTPVEIVNGEGKTIGTFRITSDGSYTFNPATNYSGPGPVVTYTATSGGQAFGGTDGTRTLTLSVTPISDKPTLPGGNVTTPEDTRVPLGLKAPSITDATDLTGSGDPHDSPERLGAITLSGIPKEVTLYKPDGTEIWKSPTENGSVRILLTDQPYVNGADEPGVIQMTKDEYESLMVLPPKDSGVDFTVKVSATSYEVDDNGAKLPNVDGTTSTANVKVTVQAVTDPVGLTIDGGTTYTVTNLVEEGTFNIATLLAASFLGDTTDNSEKRWLEIDTLGGKLQVFKDGNRTEPYTEEGGKFIIDLTQDPAAIPPIYVGAATDLSGALGSTTVRLVAQDKDPDTGAFAPKEDATVTLNFDEVAPVAGDVAISDITMPEDTKHDSTLPTGQTNKFLSGLRVTDTSVNPGANPEKITKIEVRDIPDGWIVKDQAGAEVTVAGGTFSLEGDAIANGLYLNYTITPPAHSASDARLTVDVTTVDSVKYAGDPNITEVEGTKTLDLKVEVTPVAEKEGVDSDGDGQPDLSMMGSHNYSTSMREDVPFDLNSEGFNLKVGWSNQDQDQGPSGSLYERTYAYLKPEILEWQGVENSANGSKFFYTDASGTVRTVTFSGTPVRVPVEFLDTLQFQAPPGVAGLFKITVQALTEDIDPETGQKATAVSGKAELTNLVVEPVPDPVTFARAQAIGKEDEPIDLDLRPTSTDPGETFNVTIEDIPDGAKLVYNGNELTPTNGKITIENFDKDAPFTIQAPQDSNANFELKVSAVSVDRMTIGGAVYGGESAPTVLQLPVQIKGVADLPTLTTSDLTTSEGAVEAALGKIALKDAFTASLSDVDGSETLSLVVTGLEADFDLQGGTLLGGEGEARKWSITKDDYDSGAASIVVKPNYSGTINVQVKAITTENDGDAKEVVKPISISVQPTPEAAIDLATSGKEDEQVKLEFDIVHGGGDTDEVINYVWLDAAQVNAAGVILSAGGVPLVAQDGWYKIDAGQLNDVYAKGGPNFSGTVNFDIRYEVTDPSADGTLASVSDTRTATYTLSLAPVTDGTVTALSNYATTDPDCVVDTTKNLVTLKDDATFSIDVKVSQQNDPDSTGNLPDTDGNEKLEYFLVSGVPAGLTIEGGSYIGYAPDDQGSYNGVWKVPADQLFPSNGELVQTLHFTADNSAGLFDTTYEEYELTVTAYTRDGEAEEQRLSDAGLKLVIDPDDGPGVYEASKVTAVALNPTVLEDATIPLKDLVEFGFTRPADPSTWDPGEKFFITLTNLPEGTEVIGMTEVNPGVWRAGYQGAANLDTLIDTISVKLPEHWNDNPNNPGQSFSLSAKIEATVSTGGKTEAQVDGVNPTITPVSDKPELSTTIEGATESESANGIPIEIDIANAADGGNATIVDGKMYVQIVEPENGTGGTIVYDGNSVTASDVTGVSGIADGRYYVIEGISTTGPQGTTTVSFQYEPASHASGEYTVKAFVAAQESGASNIVAGELIRTFTIAPENSGYEISVTSSTGPEDTMIPLELNGRGLLDTDGSEKVVSISLANIPDDYLVFVGEDETSVHLAENVGQGTWSIPLDAGGNLPAYIAIQPPLNVSGTVSGMTLNVLSGEQGLEPTMTEIPFDLNVTPVADGLTIDPTKAVGVAGNDVEINLNAAMIDTDGSETTTVTLKGLGTDAQGEAFEFSAAAGAPVTSNYDAASDTYTIEGLTYDNIGKLSFVADRAMNKTVTVNAWTVEGGNNTESTHVDGTFTVSVTAPPNPAPPSPGGRSAPVGAEAESAVLPEEALLVPGGEEETPEGLPDAASDEASATLEPSSTESGGEGLAETLGESIVLPSASESTEPAETLTSEPEGTSPPAVGTETTGSDAETTLANLPLGDILEDSSGELPLGTEDTGSTPEAPSIPDVPSGAGMIYAPPVPDVSITIQDEIINAHP